MTTRSFLFGTPLFFVAFNSSSAAYLLVSVEVLLVSYAFVDVDLLFEIGFLDSELFLWVFFISSIFSFALACS